MLLERYWRQEPWGSYRDNLHAAIIAQKLHQVFSKKGSKAPALGKFLLVLREEHERQSLSNFIGWARGLARPRGEKKKEAKAAKRLRKQQATSQGKPKENRTHDRPRKTRRKTRG